MSSDKVIQADNKLFGNAIFKAILLEIKTRYFKPILSSLHPTVNAGACGGWKGGSYCTPTVSPYLRLLPTVCLAL